MFGEMPVYGFFIRCVRGITLEDVEIDYLKEDLRPAFLLDNVKDAGFHHVKARHAPEVPTFVLKKVEGFSAHQCGSVPDTKLDSVIRKEF